MAEAYKNDVEKLKYHLDLLLDEETDRPAEEMDVKKIGRILEMMEMCRERCGSSGMDRFAEEFNRRNGASIKTVRNSRIHHLPRRIAKAAACFLLFAFLFGGTELAAVKAFDFSIIQFIGSSAGRLIFHVKGEIPGGIGEVSTEGSPDYETLAGELGIRFLMPGPGLSDSMELESMEYDRFADSITAVYKNSGSYAIWTAILPSGQGVIDYSARGLEKVKDGLSAGDKEVSVYRMEADGKEVYTAVFVYEDILYFLEGDLSVDEMITIIKEAGTE